MQLSGQLHAAAALPSEKDSPVSPLDAEIGEPQSESRHVDKDKCLNLFNSF
jgi:hypothetical protein